jgi:hypothetical protein
MSKPAAAVWSTGWPCKSVLLQQYTLLMASKSNAERCMHTACTSNKNQVLHLQLWH